MRGNFGLDQAAASEMLFSVINEVFPDNDYRNGHRAMSLEQVEAAHKRMIVRLNSRLESREWATFKEMETMNGVGQIPRAHCP